MKKLITVSSVISVLAGSSAFAKTEGNYLGVELLRTKAEHLYKTNGVVNNTLGKFDDSATGYGLNYKYAFNFGNNVFVAPGIFYDKIGTSAEDLDHDPINIQSRYGVKLDVGYDLTNQAAIYFTNGFAKTRYSVDWLTTNSGEIVSTTPFVYFYGIGATYQASKNITFNAEYNRQHISLMSPSAIVTARSKIEVMKVGIAYSF